MDSTNQRRLGAQVELFEQHQRQARLLASNPPAHVPSRMVIGPDGVIITDPEDHGSYARDFHHDFR